MNKLPHSKLNAMLFTPHHLVYGWYRHPDYLYIGASKCGFRRVFQHNFGVEEGDEIHFWYSPNIFQLEKELKLEHNPLFQHHCIAQHNYKPTNRPTSNRVKLH